MKPNIELLEKLEAICASGPWLTEQHTDETSYVKTPAKRGSFLTLIAHAELIAEMRNSLPALLAYIRDLEAANAAQREHIKKLEKVVEVAKNPALLYYPGDELNDAQFDEICDAQAALENALAALEKEK